MTATAPTPDGAAAPPAPPTTEEALEVLRRRPVVTELFSGFGPLVVAVGLLLAMVLLAPSIAPERIVETPADAPSTEAAP